MSRFNEYLLEKVVYKDNLISMSKNFYVYAHYTLDTNELFYIGKGKGGRCNHKYNRNDYWNRIVNKHNYRIEKLVENLEESDAFIQEILAIKEFSPKANLTKGGEGTVGLGPNVGSFEKNRTPWNKGKTCPNISKRQLGSKNHRFGKKSLKRKVIVCQNDQRTFNSIQCASSFYGINRTGILNFLSGNTYSVRGMVFTYKNDIQANKTALKNRLLKKRDTLLKKEEKPVLCLETGKKYKSVPACASKLQIHQSNIHKVLSGERKTTGGYRFQYV